MAKLNIDKQEKEFLDKTIQHWEAEKLIDADTAEKLNSSYDVKGFDWKRLAQYSFWVALSCGIIAITSLIVNDAILNWLTKLYDTPDIVISAVSGILAANLFYAGSRRKQKYPERVFSNETIIFFGVLFTASSIAYLGKTFDNGSGHFSVLFLLSVIVYGWIALKLRSGLIWAFALISLGSWFGTETGYQTNWSYYFLGMNYPFRFVIFGFFLVLFSFLIRKLRKIDQFSDLTYIIGLLYSFISLWLLSIFGNFGTLADWLLVKQINLIFWGVMSILICGAVTIYGLSRKDNIAREFGITFLLINLYSRYFEYLWDITDKTIFFAILALSFWLIGRKAEKIWNLQIFKK